MPAYRHTAKRRAVLATVVRGMRPRGFLVDIVAGDGTVVRDIATYRRGYTLREIVTYTSLVYDQGVVDGLRAMRAEGLVALIGNRNYPTVKGIMRHAHR